MEKIDNEINFAARIGGKGKGKKKAPIMKRLEAVFVEEDARIPERLSRQAYNPTWLVSLSEATQQSLGMKDFDVVNQDGSLNKP